MAEKKQHTVGKPEDFPVGKMKCLTVDGRNIGVVRMKSGELKAMRDHCPHKGAPVCKGFISGTALPSGVGEMIWGRDGEILVCPWHGYEYDIKTGECAADRRLKLKKYKIVQRGDEIYVAI